MRIRIWAFLPALLAIGTAYGQYSFTPNPEEAHFVTEDIPRFWQAFDVYESNGGNPFKDYIADGTPGLQDFIRYRIESPKNLKKIVSQKKSDYEGIRVNSERLNEIFPQTRAAYRKFKELYKDAMFPPTYFVIGAYNSGGTSSSNGLIIGTEMQSDIENIPYMVAHELIHFNQDYPPGKMTLLDQCIMEGSADFVGEMISGKNINEEAVKYGKANEEELCREFIAIMDDDGYHGWLYGTKGKKEGRPNDLGYWMGYEISAAYYEKAEDKIKALRDILNINNFREFLDASGYLAPYMSE